MGFHTITTETRRINRNCKLHKANTGGKPPNQSIPLSLGRVDPAPHTQHLLGPFEAIAQNSLLRSFSIVDSLAHRQHSCRGSEELAIRFQATPSYFAALRATPSGGRPRTPSYSEPLRARQSSSKPLRATPRHSEWLLELSELSERLIRATRALPAATRASKAGKNFAGLRATPS